MHLCEGPFQGSTERGDRLVSSFCFSSSCSTMSLVALSTGEERSPSTIKVSSSALASEGFQGSCASDFLLREWPLGWLEEFSKLEGLESAGASAHLLTSNIIWPVKFRLINRDTVLPSQVTTLTPPLSSPDSSFHERANAGGEEVALVCASENHQILHWKLCSELPVQVCDE